MTLPSGGNLNVCCSKSFTKVKTFALGIHFSGFAEGFSVGIAVPLHTESWDSS